MSYKEYFHRIFEILEKIEKTQGENIKKAADIVTECVINDGILHTFGTGHSHCLAEDIFARAGTLVPVHAILEPSMTGHRQNIKSIYMEKIEGIGDIILNYHKVAPPDALLVISNSGNNAAPIEVAMEGRSRGVKVIAVVCLTYMNSLRPRHSSGKKLGDMADVVIDNCGEVGDTCLRYDGLEQGVGATSTVAGSFIINAILAQAVENLLKQGIEPPVFWSGNLEGGMEANQKYLDRYWARIRNL